MDYIKIVREMIEDIDGTWYVVRAWIGPKKKVLRTKIIANKLTKVEAQYIVTEPQLF